MVNLLLQTKRSKENGYDSPVFSSTKDGHLHINVDIGLLKKGFTLHYFMGLLGNITSERQTYSINKKYFINNKKLKKNRTASDTTINRVFFKERKCWNSSERLSEIRKLIKLT